jgi:hypothetical protein
VRARARDREESTDVRDPPKERYLLSISTHPDKLAFKRTTIV